MLLNALNEALNLVLLSALLSFFFLTSLDSTVKAECPKLTFYHDNLILSSHFHSLQINYPIYLMHGSIFFLTA
jgi:hypothetical protein